LLLRKSSLLLSSGFCGEMGDLVEDGGVGYDVFKGSGGWSADGVEDSGFPGRVELRLRVLT
jgi:hypothetical protein